MPVVDMHQHLLPPGLIELLRQRTEPPYIDGAVLVTCEGRFPFDPAEHEAERRIRLLDSLEIGVAVMSFQPTLGQHALGQGEQAELAVAWEEGLTDIVAASGDRVVALAAGPMRPGFVGSCIGTDAFAHETLDALEPVMESLSGRRGLLFVHPSGGPTRGSAPPWWGALTLYTAQMQDAYLRWLADGQPRWPDVRVVFAILAGGGPFQIERLASRGVGVRSALHDTVFFDTASYGRRALELCIETFGVEQLVYGSDLPVIDPAPTRLAVRGFGASRRTTHHARHADAAPLMTNLDLSTWLAGRLAGEADLDRAALLRLATDLGAEESLWRGLVSLDTIERHYTQMYRDPHVDIWLICWSDGQDTGYHDHDRSQGAVYVCEGAVYEDYFQRGKDGWIREETNRHDTGGFFDFDATYIHGVRHAAGSPAVSVHCYSPALWRMGHYEPDPSGVMRRVSMTYADELLGRCLTPPIRPPGRSRQADLPRRGESPRSRGDRIVR